MPESLQLAIIRHESGFRAEARPPRKRYLGFIPGPRLSSAYGFGQIVDGTWETYREATGKSGADRDDFADVTDFIGWYGDRVHRRFELRKNDAFNIYLAYHEGLGGYARKSHDRKPRLLKVARQVQAQAWRYEEQLASCHDDL